MGSINDENDIVIRSDANPLEKLLYAIVWKNGDLLKLRHVIHGIVDSDVGRKGKNGVVFYQFGKHLSKLGKPIIDQHVLRAFAVYDAIVNAGDPTEYII